MAARSDIDTARLGLWSISQSGWVAPIVSNRSSLARFSIVVTGGGASPRQVEEFGYDQRLRHQGSSLESIPAATELLEAYFSYLETGEGRAALLRMIDSARQQPWYDALNLDRVLPSDTSRPAWAWVATYDPLPDIQMVKIPSLVLLGAQDNLAPTEFSAQRWITGLQRGGVPGSQTVLAPAR